MTYRIAIHQLASDAYLAKDEASGKEVVAIIVKLETREDAIITMEPEIANQLANQIRGFKRKR
jgi:hypothetical protein